MFLAVFLDLRKSRLSTTNQFEHFLDQEQALLQATSDMYVQGLQMGQALRDMVLHTSNTQGRKNLDNAKVEFAASFEAAMGVQAERLFKVVSIFKTQDQQARPAHAQTLLTTRSLS